VAAAEVLHEQGGTGGEMSLEWPFVDSGIKYHLELRDVAADNVIPPYESIEHFGVLVVIEGVGKGEGSNSVIRCRYRDWFKWRVGARHVAA
jgi:hypothetical protein